MYCDQTLYACVPGAALTDGGTYSGGDGFIPYCDPAKFCLIVPPTQAFWTVGAGGIILQGPGMPA